MSNTIKIHNFSAGPSILAESALEKSIADIKNFANIGLSILEISHRSKQFEAVMDDTRTLIKDLLGLSDEYDILFLGGGASSQFYQIPMNFLRTKFIVSSRAI
jgi:phosphoserine aminotransferase